MSARPCKANARPTERVPIPVSPVPARRERRNRSYGGHPDGANRHPRRTASAIHWLFPSREHLTITIAVEMALTAVGLPPWAHLLLGALVHHALAWLS